MYGYTAYAWKQSELPGVALCLSTETLGCKLNMAVERRQVRQTTRLDHDPPAQEHPKNTNVACVIKRAAIPDKERTLRCPTQSSGKLEGYFAKLQANFGQTHQLHVGHNSVLWLIHR